MIIILTNPLLQLLVVISSYNKARFYSYTIRIRKKKKKILLEYLKNYKYKKSNFFIKILPKVKFKSIVRNQVLLNAT